MNYCENDRYCDAHAHLSEQLKKEILQKNIYITLNCANVEELAEVRKLQQIEPRIKCSYGIHPWDSDKYKFEEQMINFEESMIIGEIGMDSVWCDIDIHIQEQIFHKQLEYAFYHHKPVILHTKGEESSILKMIAKYPNNYLVHWYSCSKYIDEYIALGCYFTIGPFPSLDANLKLLVQKVPLNRLLIESDGIAAISWALKEPLEYSLALARLVDEIAMIKNISPQKLQTIIFDNYQNWIKKAES